MNKNNVRAFVEIRNQKTKGKAPKCGPDIYFAVQVVPEGVEPLKVLRNDYAQKRGIRIKYFGEGYKQSQGPRSIYQKNLLEAKQYAARINRRYQPSFEQLAKQRSFL